MTMSQQRFNIAGLHSRSHGWRVWLVAAVVVLCMGLPGRALAATIVVNSLADTIANDGVCTLREAIDNANSNAATHADCTAGKGGANTITFSVSGTITLGSTLPTITSVLTLDGTGTDLSIDGNHAV